MPDLSKWMRYALPLGLIATAIGIFDFIVVREASGFLVAGLILLAVAWAEGRGD